MSTEDDAQVQAIKDWWKKYGTTALVAVAVAVALVYGVRFIQQQKYNTAANASAFYDEYQQALLMNNTEVLDATYNAIHNDYKNTPYAGAVSLIEAARAANVGELEAAQEHLVWVIEDGDKFAKPIAKLRLAELMVQQQEYESALDMLNDVDEQSPYKPAYDELKGDVLILTGDVPAALVLYQEALVAYQQQGFDNLLLQYKLQTYAPGE